MPSLDHLKTRHRQRTGAAQPRIFRAPGRVNLVGEHTDYCDGYCMPAGLNFATLIALSARTDGQLVMESLALKDSVAFNLASLPAEKQQHWSDYPVGVARQLQARGIALTGVDITIYGDVPRNAGLSSSASLEVVTATGLLGAANAKLPSREIALLCQAAENNFVGAPCGIMDQFISVHAREHAALALDCRDLSFRYVRLPAHLRLVIANSMVKHSVADGGEYANVRGRVEEGVRILRNEHPQLQIVKLRDVSLELLNATRDKMSDVVFRACRHIITDSQRVLDGCDLLRDGNVAEFGKLLVAAHASYRDDFEASCAECDVLVETALPLDGCYGSRLTGGGFGGCTVSLVEADQAEGFREQLIAGYRAATGITADAWVCEIGGGAAEIV